MSKHRLELSSRFAAAARIPFACLRYCLVWAAARRAGYTEVVMDQLCFAAVMTAAFLLQLLLHLRCLGCWVYTVGYIACFSYAPGPRVGFALFLCLGLVGGCCGAKRKFAPTLLTLAPCEVALAFCPCLLLFVDAAA